MLERVPYWKEMDKISIPCRGHQWHMQKQNGHQCAAKQDDTLLLFVLFSILLLDCAKENIQMFL
jgi:hypothetical protein